MNNENKNRIICGVKILAIFLWAILTAATCAGVWNYCPETTIKVLAALLFGCNAVAVVYCYKATIKKYDENERSL